MKKQNSMEVRVHAFYTLVGDNSWSVS